LVPKFLIQLCAHSIDTLFTKVGWVVPEILQKISDWPHQNTFLVIFPLILGVEYIQRYPRTAVTSKTKWRWFHSNIFRNNKSNKIIINNDVNKYWFGKSPSHRLQRRKPHLPSTYNYENIHVWKITLEFWRPNVKIFIAH
jgi:hypothetical protein